MSPSLNSIKWTNSFWLPSRVGASTQRQERTDAGRENKRYVRETYEEDKENKKEEKNKGDKSVHTEISLGMTNDGKLIVSVTIITLWWKSWLANLTLAITLIVRK